MPRHAISLYWLLVPALIALLMLALTPSRWTGVDLGSFGAALLVLTAWAGLYLAVRNPAVDSTLSPAEQKNGVALLFAACIAAILLAEVDTIVNATTIRELRGVGRVIVALMIGWLVFGAVLRQRFGAAVQEDERDRWVQRRADAAAHGTTMFLLMGLAVTLAFSPVSRLGWARPLLIAHLLVTVMVVASLVGCLVAAWLYWRDRR